MRTRALRPKLVIISRLKSRELLNQKGNCLGLLPWEAGDQARAFTPVLKEEIVELLEKEIVVMKAIFVCILKNKLLPKDLLP